MNELINIGEVLSVNAALYADRIGGRDLDRSMSWRTWNERACRLANALLGLGLRPGDRVAALAYNSLEWLEIYAATAKAGLIVVPVNFRLLGSEILYILEDCGVRAVIAQNALTDLIEEARASLSIGADNYISFGDQICPAGWRFYEDILTSASDSEPSMAVNSNAPWALMYTSGTTGKPKGVIRSHRASSLLALAGGVEFGLARHDNAFLAMPMCHANSLFFCLAACFSGATCSIYSRRSLDPEHLLRALADGGGTFTSLVPTHYSMMLGLSAAVRNRCNVDAMKKLVISSAPARLDTKLEIMKFFRQSGLFEFYGSTEAGWVTILRPEEQMTRLGTVGRECVASARIRLLDQNGAEVSDGAVGELFSRTPWSFDGYWNLPEKTAEAVRGEYCSVGDLARRDAEGYIHLVDRKSSMIISGGENIYPSEVEAVISSHPSIEDVAIVGVPDEKWGERVHGVVILRDGASLTATELIDWCQNKLAGYKRPRSVSFISEEDMPRTATGKIQHRILKGRFSEGTRSPP